MRWLVIVGLSAALCGCGKPSDPGPAVDQLSAALRDRNVKTRRDAAKALGLSRSALYRRLKRHGL